MAYSDDNMFQNESIFDSAKDFTENQIARANSLSKKPAEDGIMLKFAKKIMQKVGDYEDKIKIGKLAGNIEKELRKEEDILNLLGSFGCTLTYKSAENIEIDCPKYNLVGHINPTLDDENCFDETALKIIQNMMHEINASDNIENTIDRLESEGFYPVGSLEKITAIIEDKECEVLVGKFLNKEGQERKIYFYNGQEVFLKEE